eukprot:321359-Pleurochrysis_carterae.AAC.3
MPITSASKTAAALLLGDSASHHRRLSSCTRWQRGSTRTASGDRSFFPANRITQLNPNMRVIVARNGVTLPVKCIGSIVLLIHASNVCNGHGDYSCVGMTLELLDALYVSGLYATLLSTKAMFKMQGIRTYLKDKLRLVPPNDNHVRIRKTTANHNISLSTDKFVYVVTGENDTVERARGQVGQSFQKSCPRYCLGHFQRSH